MMISSLKKIKCKWNLSHQDLVNATRRHHRSTYVECFLLAFIFLNRRILLWFQRFGGELMGLQPKKAAVFNSLFLLRDKRVSECVSKFSLAVTNRYYPERKKKFICGSQDFFRPIFVVIL